MARPPKQGLEYFSLDTDFFENKKVRRIIKACGPGSATILICLLCNIYKNKGYYILWDENLPFDISDIVGVSEGQVIETMNKALQVEFFSKEKHSKFKILTSYEIQKRYCFSVSKRIDSEIKEKYKIIENEVSEEKTIVSDTETHVSDAETTITGSESTHKKRKEKKVNNNKENNTKEKFDFKKSCIGLGAEEKIVSDWMIVRKQKKAANTETAFNSIKNQIEISGLSANDCIRIAVEKSWSGFNAQWVFNLIEQNNGTASKNRSSRKEGTSWDELAQIVHDGFSK